MSAFAWLRRPCPSASPPESSRGTARRGLLASLLLLPLLVGLTPDAAAQSRGISVGIFGQNFSYSAKFVLEGGSVALGVVLNSEPASDVTVTVSGHSGTDLRVDTDSGSPGDQTTLTFTPSNWNISRKVTVRALEDADTADETEVILTFRASAANNYNSVEATFGLTVNDDDVVDASGFFPDYTYTAFFAQSTFVAEEDDGFVEVQLKLSRALPEDVVLKFRYDDLTTDRLDYHPVTRIWVPAGDANPVLRIKVYNDKGVEENELFRIFLIKGPKYTPGGNAVQTDVIIKNPDYWTFEDPHSGFTCFGGKMGDGNDYPLTKVLDPDTGRYLDIPHRGYQVYPRPTGLNVTWDKASNETYRAGETAKITVSTRDGERSCTRVGVDLLVTSQTQADVDAGRPGFSSGNPDNPLRGGGGRKGGGTLFAGNSEAVIELPLLADGRIGFTLNGAGAPVYIDGSSTAESSFPTGHIWRTVSTPAGVSFVRASLEVSESTAGTVNLRVNISPAATADFDLTYSLSGTATRGADYTIPGVTGSSGTVSVPVGARSVNIPVTIVDDAIEDSGETIVLNLQASGNYSVATPGTMTVTIMNHDPDAPDWTDYQTVVNYLIQVRDHPENTAVKGNPAHIRKWNRVLAAIGHASPEPPMAASEIHANAAKWPDSPFKPASVYLTSQEQDPDEPEIAVSAGEAVTEGGDASFTITATPPPAADLPVSVTVATDGDWGVTAGSRTVTIPTTGSATLTLTTAGDDADEPDGSVSVTVTDGEGYTVGSSASGSVTVQDDDGETSPDYTEYQTVVNYLIQVRDHPENTAVQGHPAHIAKWNRVLAAIGHASPEPPMAASEIHANAAKWPDSPFKPASVYLNSVDAQGQQDQQQSQQQDQQQEPAITVSAGDAVTEGGDATFTITATPAPTSPLAVDVSVTTDGAYGVTAGTQTVTLPTTGSFTLELTTTDDATDEPDGSVSVTVSDGNGYTAGDPASGTVAVNDDDLPPPVVTVTAGNAVTEGGNAVFTLTADRAPASDLTLTLSVAETGAGDHVAAADEGPATAVIAKDATEAVFTVATVNDEVDEPDGAAVVTVQAGEGYTVGDPASGTVTVKDDDVATLAVLSVADETVREGVDWLMTFTVRLSAPAAQAVEVRVDTRPSTPVSARTPADYWPLEGTVVRFPAGETEQAVQVLVYDDNHDEDPETFELVLSDATGATIGDGVAVGTIVNNDSMPAAFLARFGRTLAQQTLDGIAGRLAAPRTPGLQGTLAGNPLNIEPAGGGDDTSTGMLARVLAGILQGVGRPATPDDPTSLFDDDPRRGALQAPTRLLTAREALLGSRFTLTSQPDATGGSLGFWGRAAQGYFDGAARGDGTAITLDGTVTTGLLGADYARGPWLLGVALTQSTATGTYAALGGPPCDSTGCAEAVRAGTGQTETALTAAIPYAALQVSERLQLWGAGGYGAGDVTLKTRDARYEADTTWAMAAAGLRGALLAPTGGADGPAVALTSDALWTRTASDRTSELAASASQVTRLRLGLAGSWRLAVGSAPADAGPGGSLTPKLELGARHDGGDAETGLGIELGGGVLWVEPTLGLSLDLAGRTLLAHENDDLEDQGFSAALAFDPTPATPRGPSLHLRQDVGSPATGGLDALFTDAPLATRTGQAALSRWALEAAYGLPAFGGAFTGSPYVGVGLAPSARSYRLGWRLAPETARAATLTVDLTATRQERDAAPPVHTLQVGVTAQW